ncbi:MAG TPA: hypothetical protein VGI10_02645 [Polyangiaceae bacterium]|jgi:hypothetical protein
MRLGTDLAFEHATEPASGQSIVERPPPGLARGAHPTSPWLIAAIALSALIVTVLYFLSRARSRPR